MSDGQERDAQGRIVVRRRLLTPKQQEFMQVIRNAPYSKKTLLGYGGSMGSGKGLDVATPIPTPSGWTRMGDLSFGDVVFGPDGNPCNVTAVSDTHHRSCYKVILSDGSELIADDEHQWSVFPRDLRTALFRRTPEFRERRRAKRPSRVTGLRSEAFTAAVIARNHRLPPETLPPPPPIVVSTVELREMVLETDFRNAIAIRVNGGLQLPEAELPFDPYILGLWLGDGTTSSGSMTCSLEDSHILQAFVEAGYEVTKRADALAYGVRGLTQDLRDTGLLNNKHIPAMYLRAAKEQRLELLRGLMDTDGFACKTKGTVEFTTTKEALRDGAIELIRSLGWRANVLEGRATIAGRDCGPKWRIQWTPDDIVFRMERKATLQKMGGERTKWRYIRAVEPVDTVPTRCIRVDSPSECYLAGETFTVTHNSAVLVEANIDLATDFPGCRLLIGRKDFKDLHDTTMKLFDEVCPQAILGGPNGKPGRNDQWNWRRIRLPHWPPEVFSEILFRPLSDVNDFGSAEFMAASFDESHEVPENSAQYVLTRLRQRLPAVVERRMEAVCLTCTAEAKRPVMYVTGDEQERHSAAVDAFGNPHKMQGSTKYLFMATANPFPGFFKSWFVDGLLDSEAMEAVGGGGVHFVRALPRDNPHLPPTYESEMRALYGNTTFVKRMMDGDWGAFEGQIYQNFEPSVHEWRRGDPEPGQYKRVIGGLDFGGERLDSHYSTGVVAVVTNTNRVILVDEFKGRGPDIAAKQLMWMLGQQKRWCNQYTNSKIEWRADRSQMVGIQMWRNMGMHITYSKGGPDSVLEGIKHVQSLLEKDEAGLPGLLYLPHMREFRQEMIEYHWDEDKLKPFKKKDDLCDASRYLCELIGKVGGDPNVLLRNKLAVVS